MKTMELVTESEIGKNLKKQNKAKPQNLNLTKGHSVAYNNFHHVIYE